VLGDTLSQIEILSAFGEAWVSRKVTAEESTRYFNDARTLLLAFDEDLDLPRLLVLAHEGRQISAEQLTVLQQEKLLRFGRRPLMVAGNLYQKWGRVTLESGNLDEAILLLRVAYIYHQTLRVDREAAFEQATDHYFLAEAFRRKGQLENALSSFDLAARIAQAIRSPEIHWVYAGMARTYADLGDITNAVDFYKKGLSILESLYGYQETESLKTRLVAGSFWAYRDLISLLLALHGRTKDSRYLQEAFQYNERLRARAFLEIFAESRATRAAGQVGLKEANVRLEMNMIHRQLQSTDMESAESTRLLDRLNELRRRWRGVQEDLAQKDPRYAEIVSPKPVTIAEVQSVLDRDTVFLEYSVGSEFLTLWVITAGEVHYVEIGPGHEEILNKYLPTLRQPLIGSKEILNHITLGKQLYQTVIGSAEKYLRGKKQIIVAPDGPLYYLPLETLIIPGSRDEGHKVNALADVKYLIKQFSVSYVPSATVLVSERRETHWRPKIDTLPLLAFGDSIYRDEKQEAERHRREPTTTNL
jgi:tetratricopeptide (TPR) repeat protein